MLTIARSLFRLRNTSCFFMVLNLTMSSGNSKSCSTTSAMYLAFPFKNSLIDEFAGRGDPSITKGGF